MKPYVIKEGDFLTKLAHTLGFEATTVWNDAKNAKLKKLRKDPDLLLAGDILFVPDKARKKLSYTKESDNAYVAKVPKIEVTIALEKDGEPIANEEYVLEGLGDDEPKTTDENGNAVIKAPVHVREVVLRFTKRDEVYQIRFGELDPADTPSGARKRLTHLGLYTGVAEQSSEADEKQLAAALAEFQRRNKLKPSGELDDATSKALVDAHGS
jgi:hypothetical protein